MLMRRFDPFREVLDLNRLFAEAFAPIGRGVSIPRVDILDEGDEILVKAELPGIEDKNQIELYVQKDHLIIKGQVKDEMEARNDKIYRKEIFAGSFERVVYLPVEVEPAKATAEYKNGILNIRLKKAQDNLRGFKVDIQ
ncbi:Hsp20/alpha crystallin family protein [Carboxydothermus islandicus]|nr:Hsp20/alpha crystallin family protein [Carboxydothermus islandicus]